MTLLILEEVGTPRLVELARQVCMVAQASFRAQLTGVSYDVVGAGCHHLCLCFRLEQIAAVKVRVLLSCYPHLWTGCGSNDPFRRRISRAKGTSLYDHPVSALMMVKPPISHSLTWHFILCYSSVKFVMWCPSRFGLPAVTCKTLNSRHCKPLLSFLQATLRMPPCSATRRQCKHCDWHGTTALAIPFLPLATTLGWVTVAIRAQRFTPALQVGRFDVIMLCPFGGQTHG
jgi:hypothetical protein